MTQPTSTRRATLTGALAAGASLALGAPVRAARDPARTLGQAVYGSAVRPDALRTDPAYAAALVRHCRIVVPEGDLNWAVVRPGRDAFTFEAADRIAAFAVRNGLELRGHNLAWYSGMPAWAEAITAPAEAERALTRHIETLVSRYRGLARSWIVVNEPTPEHPASATELRPYVWPRVLGPDYIAIAFRAAAAADPGARLILNEYDIEFVGARFALRREILLGIARRLVDQGVPIHAIGLQGHLFAEREIDRDGLQAFIRAIRAMGLDVMVTELDVVDYALPGDIAARDARVAASARTFLKAVAEVAPPSSIVTWGISDRYTWVPIWFARKDGLPNRPLPLDAEMRPKPFMNVIEQFARDVS